ncbi:MAG TPA: hypothetical protein VJ866_19840 [Pyrinomonadaceae bacterium]|nr:hypothetical protein [Pyrinomonadaceae bacterium]
MTFSRSTVYVLVIVAIGAWMLQAGTGFAGQNQDRVVDKATLTGEPIRIAGMKTKKKGEIKFGGKFVEDDDWVEGFTILVHNISGKTITALAVDATFHRPDGKSSRETPPFSYTFHFGPNPLFPEYSLRDKTKIIKPGETVELSLPDEDYEGIKGALKQLNYPGSVKRVELMIHTVGFEDGTVWSGGSWFYRDPDNPDKLIREKRPQGRAQNRSADFFSAQIHNLRQVRAGTFYASVLGSRTEPTFGRMRGRRHPAEVVVQRRRAFDVLGYIRHG